MYVKEVFVKKFRHLEDVQIGPFSAPSDSSDLVVLAGPNGGGKSSVLELLGFALSNMWSLTWALRRSFPQYAFEVTLALTSQERIQVRELKDIYPQVADYFEDNCIYYPEK